jgi:hypothetical protein
MISSNIIEANKMKFSLLVKSPLISGHAMIKQKALMNEVIEKVFSTSDEGNSISKEKFELSLNFGKSELDEIQKEGAEYIPKFEDIPKGEYNVFLNYSLNNKEYFHLLGTSGPENKKYYLDYLQTGMGKTEKEECINRISKKIVKIFKNIQS